MNKIKILPNNKLTIGKKIYFLSDSHLGVPTYEKSLQREKLIVKWLNEVSQDAQEIYLLGDIFDFWFEYKAVVPKGYIRLLGTLANIADKGIKIHYFTGNHDMWVFDYFEKEIGVKVYKAPIRININNKEFLIGHGDGLGPSDYGYKFIKYIFSNPVCQWLFARFHPNFGIGLALFFSRKSRIANGNRDEIFLGEEKERLIQYCKNHQKQENINYYIFGHRHLPMDIEIDENSHYINIGEWVNKNSYAVFDGDTTKILYYK